MVPSEIDCISMPPIKRLHEILARNPMPDKRSFIALFFVVVLAVALRLIRLGTFSLWHDECHNLLISEDLYGAVVHGELIANHPPLPYIMLAAWRFIGMDYNEWTIRGMPLIFGVLGVVAVFWLARLLFGNRVGVISAFLLAISPFHVLHSQDLKEYIYLPFFASVMVGFFYLAVTGNRKRDWFLYGLLAGVCCYTEAFVAPLLVTINFWFLAQWPRVRKEFKNWFFANVFGVLLFLPWLGIMLGRVHLYLVKAEHWWVPWPDFWSIIFYFKTIAFGYASAKPYFHLAFFVFAFAAILGSIIALFKNRRGATLLISWMVVPVAIVFALSYVGQSIFLTRAMIPYAIPVYILVAVCISAFTVPAVRSALLIGITILCSVGLYNYYERNFHPEQHPHHPGVHPPQEYKAAARHIRDHLEDGDIVIHASLATWLPFQWYGFKGQPHYTGGMHEPFNKMIASANPVNTTYDYYLRLWPEVLEELIHEDRRVWFIFSEWEREYLRGNAMAVYRWLDSKFAEVEHTSFEGIDLLLYLTPNHPNMPEVLERTEDTGVSSLLTYSTLDTHYFKVMPDADLVATPLEQRLGNMVLRFSTESETLEEDKSVTISIENKSDAAVNCTVMFLQSSLLVPLDSLSRINAKENDWEYSSYWNLPPPPQTYDLGTVTGCFTQGMSKIAGTITLKQGNYFPYVYTIAPWNTQKWSMAPISITANHQLLVGSNNMPVLPEPQWRWVKGEPYLMGETGTLDIEVAAESLDGASESWANLAYLAFVDEQLQPPAAHGSSFYPEWPGEVTVPAGEALSWEKEIDTIGGRVDVWAFERNNDQGKAYHIFRLFSANE